MRNSRVERQRRNKKKYLYLKIFILTVLFVVSFVGGRLIAGFGSPDAPPVALEPNEKGELLPVDRLNVLLLGIDARKGEKDARTDSMIVVSIDRATKKIAMVSIPRDTMVEIPGHGREKINAANIYGGVDLARETVEDLLGVEIPYYVKTNFEGFKDIVDTLGGVTIDVEKRMVYRAEGIDLYPGVQRLDGYNALGYVRFRYDTLGDISRTERQQKFLTALAKEMLQASSIIKLPKLVPQIASAVDTNLNVKDMYFLTKVAANIDSQNIVTATLPGIFYNVNGGSYWKADEEQAKLVLNDLFAGVKVAAVEGSYSEPVKKVAQKPAAKEPKPVSPDAVTIKEPGTEEQPPDGGQPPADGQQPGGPDGSPGTQPGSGTTPGGQTGGSQPAPPTNQPVNPPTGQPAPSPANPDQSGGTTGTTPQTTPQAPSTTGGSASGTGTTQGTGGTSGTSGVTGTGGTISGGTVPGVNGV